MAMGEFTTRSLKTTHQLDHADRFSQLDYCLLFLQRLSVGSGNYSYFECTDCYGIALPYRLSDRQF